MRCVICGGPLATGVSDNRCSECAALLYMLLSRGSDEVSARHT